MTTETLYIAPLSRTADRALAGEHNTFTDGDAAAAAAESMDQTNPLPDGDEWVICYRGPATAGGIVTGGDAIAAYLRDTALWIPRGEVHETECQYCGRSVHLASSRAVSAELEWAARAAQHARHCEWIATRGHQLDTPSDERIRGLRTAAGEAGDLEQVELCDRALEGEAAAIARCAMALRDADAQRDDA